LFSSLSGSFVCSADRLSSQRQGVVVLWRQMISISFLTLFPPNKTIKPKNLKESYFSVHSGMQNTVAGKVVAKSQQ
jgi:hypothetical protein